MVCMMDRRTGTPVSLCESDAKNVNIETYSCVTR
jgi:hypothetical protein